MKMSKKRLSFVVGILLLCIVSCLVPLNLSTISDEITRYKTSRSLDEAGAELSNATNQIPLESDSLILSEIDKPYIPDDRPECIVSYSYQVFASGNDYEATRSMFVEKFAALGWKPGRTKFTPYVQINYLSPSDYLIISIFPSSEFERLKINIPNSLLDEEKAYAILYTYQYPDPDTCFLAG
jgi:hypothetical protein